MMSLKILYRILFLILSLFLCLTSFAQERNSVNSRFIDEKARAEQLLRAEEIIIREIKEDIVYLLKSKDRERVDDNVFGNCIHLYLSTEDSLTIAAERVVQKLSLLFDADFMTTLNHLKIADNLLLVGKEESVMLDEQGKYYNTIRILVPIKDSEYDSAKTYWFYKKGEHWIFAGMTCIG